MAPRGLCVKTSPIARGASPIARGAMSVRDMFEPPTVRAIANGVTYARGERPAEYLPGAVPALMRPVVAGLTPRPQGVSLAPWHMLIDPRALPPTTSPEL